MKEVEGESQHLAAFVRQRDQDDRGGCETIREEGETGRREESPGRSTVRERRESVEIGESGGVEGPQACVYLANERDRGLRPRFCFLLRVLSYCCCG